MINKLFTNLKKMIYDRVTGDIILSNSTLDAQCIGYQYNQSFDSTLWTIKHKFNTTNAIVDVYVTIDDETQKVIPNSIVFENKNTVKINFTEPTSGFVNIFFLCDDEEIIIP